MKALILSAGEGTRLRPLTNTIPKVMVPILGKPMLEYQINLLKKHSVRDIFINLYFLPQTIMHYFGNGKKLGVRITYIREDKKTSYHGPQLLGSAGALHNVKNQIDDNLLVLYGDVYSTLNLTSLIKFHKDKQSMFTLVVQKSKHPQDSDLVMFDRSLHVTAWIKKPHKKLSGYNNAGTYILNKEILEYLPNDVPIDFGHDFIPLLLEKKVPTYVYKTNDFMMDMGTQERYNKLIERVENE